MIRGMDPCGNELAAGVAAGPDRAALAERALAAAAAMTRCRLCERRCEVNRWAGEEGFCRQSAEAFCYRRYLSFTDPLESMPALRVYLRGCSFRCRFCNTAPESWGGAVGGDVPLASLAEEAASAVRRGAKSISLLGGEPTIHPAGILDLAAAAPGPLPIVLDTNGYMSPQVITLLDGVVDAYLVDFKFGNDGCAERLAGVWDYLAVVERNLALLAGRSRLVVRHLLVPGHEACCFRRVVDRLSRRMPGARFHLMTSYVPGRRCGTDRDWGRLNNPQGVRDAAAYLAASELQWSTDLDDPR